VVVRLRRRRRRIPRSLDHDRGSRRWHRARDRRFPLQDTVTAGPAPKPQPSVFPLPHSAPAQRRVRTVAPSEPRGLVHVRVRRWRQQRDGLRAAAREEPGPRPRVAVVAAARVRRRSRRRDSRHALAVLGPDLRPSTVPAAAAPRDVSLSPRLPGTPWRGGRSVPRSGLFRRAGRGPSPAHARSAPRPLTLALAPLAPPPVPM